MDREMTQQDLVRALKKEDWQAGLSQSYLSQIESGARPHLTNASRMLLARFFKVHPGYLVDDPEGYHTELTSDLRATEDRLDLWLINGAEQFAHDPELHHALLQVAKHGDTRKCSGAAGRDSGDAGAGGAADRSVEAGAGSVAASRTRNGKKPAERNYDAWAIFYLVCFLVGVTLSVLSFLGGGWHLPHVHHAMCRTRMFAPQGGHVATPHAAGAAHAAGAEMPFFNFAHHHRVSRLVWRHGLPADALLDAGGHAWYWCLRWRSDWSARASSSCLSRRC